MTLVFLAASVLFFAAIASRLKWYTPLRKICSMAKRHPVDAVVVSVLASWLVAFGGTKGGVIRGITLDRVCESPDGVELSWTADDARITPGTVYLIQRRQSVFDEWETLARTTETNAVLDGFTLDRDYTYRIATEVTDD